MDEYILRPAIAQEAEMLAAIRSEYVRSLYRGFLSADFLKGASQEYYLPRIARMIGDQGSYVDVLETSGQVVGYIVYGADSDNSGYGLIQEEAILPEYGRREKDALAQHAVRQLGRLGYEMIHLWVLRDNFRVRFLYESMGFRPDGSIRVTPREDLQLDISRYAYRIPASGGGRSQAASIE